jgi:hypothetical protein
MPHRGSTLPSSIYRRNRLLAGPTRDSNPVLGLQLLLALSGRRDKKPRAERMDKSRHYAAGPSFYRARPFTSRRTRSASSYKHMKNAMPTRGRASAWERTGAIR